VVGVYAGVAPENIEDAIEAILAEWNRLRQEETPPEELTRAKDLIKRQLLLFMEDSLSVAHWFGSQAILFSDILTYEEAIAAIETITAADVQRVAQQLFLEEKLNLAVVGPFQSEEEFRGLLT
jgi:predicted Zn-dependent peptidase